MKKPWSYTENIFLKASKGIYSKFLVLSTFTANALESKAGAAFFDDLITLFHPLFVAFAGEYSNLIASGGERKGETAGLTLLLKQMGKEKINKWNSMIQAVFPKGSPDYLKLLPLGHKPFQKGGIEERINIVKALSKALTGIAALVDLKTNVDDFLVLIETARGAQEGEKSEVKGHAKELKNKMNEAGVGMMQVYGQLVFHYAADLKQIEAFFDVRNLRKGLQTEFHGTVKQASIKRVVQKTFEADDKIQLSNLGDTDLKFWLAETKKTNPPATAITIAANESIVLDIEDLGPIENTYLMVSNADAINKGHYEMVVL